MEGTYDESRYYETWRNELNNRAHNLAPSNHNSKRHQDRRREIRQGTEPRHRSVKRQQGKVQRDAAQTAGKRLRCSGDDYATVGESDLHRRMKLDGSNYHSHE